MNDLGHTTEEKIIIISSEILEWKHIKMAQARDVARVTEFWRP